jgi:DNA-binding MarR family transcriptional regulator
MRPRASNVLDDSPGYRSSARVGYLVYRVERRLRSRIDQAVRPHGVTTTEYVTLSVLSRRAGMSSAELGRWAFVSAQAMNVVVQSLERRRLVRRRPDPDHRRVLRATLTAKGRAVLQLCEESMDLIEADMLRGLPPESIAGLQSMLASCAHELEATMPRVPRL